MKGAGGGGTIIQQYLNLQKQLSGFKEKNPIPENLYYMTKLLNAISKGKTFEQEKQFLDHFSLNCQSIVDMTKQSKMKTIELEDRMIDIPGKSGNKKPKY